MINLVRNELFKIFKRKSIYVMLIIILAFTVLINVVNVTSNNNTSSRDYDKRELNELKKELSVYVKGSEEYCSILSSIDSLELKLKYKENSWQEYVIDDDVSELISRINTAKCLNDKDELKKTSKEYEEVINILNNRDWKDFTNYRKKELESKIKETKDIISKVTSKSDKESYNELLNELENRLYKINIRLDKNIEYKYDYLNDAIARYNYNFPTLEEYIKEYKEHQRNHYNETETKNEYKELIIENEKAKYVIDNKIDIDNNKSLRGSIIDFVSDQSIFIIIMIIMISGSIVSTEFDKGTIKLLLIRPYSRFKVLFSKFIATLLIIIFSIIAAFTIQFITGVLFYGFSNLNVPVITYNLVTDKILYIDLFRYILDHIIAIIPQIVLLSTLAFAISTILNNSVVGVGLPILGYVLSNLINTIIYSFNVKILRYFVTPHWDLTNYLYGGPKVFGIFTVSSSLLICLAYFIIMIIPTFMVFIKKNIKNI